jgi:hypothetical protein
MHGKNAYLMLCGTVKTVHEQPSYRVEDGGVREPRLDDRGGVEHRIPPVEGSDERFLVRDVAIGREAGDVNVGEREGTHVMAGAG